MSRPTGSESPTSEVGLDHDDSRVRNNEDDEKWMRLLEQQNRNFLTLIQAMKTPTSSSHGFRLPDFDAEKQEVDARAWVTTAEMCLTNEEQHGAPLMVALSRALKGGASTWLSTVSYPGMTWADFKRLFIARYGNSATIASFLIDLQSSRPKENECLASYAAGLMSSIMARWNGLSMERLAIATILAHISQFDRRVQRLSFTTDIQTRGQLQQELQAVSFMKRKLATDDRDAPEKRYRVNNTVKPLKCFICGKLGHKSMQCYQKDVKQDTQATPKHLNHSSSKGRDSSTTAKPHASGITCFHCRAQGHYASSCPRRTERSSAGSGSSKPANEKRVDLCVLNAPTGTLNHSGEKFPFYYDSGAECSLIKESIACKFKGKRINKTVTMTGIGQTSVNSTIQILTLVEIDDINIEICFHVLSDHLLRYGIMIGREILGHGLTVQLTTDRIKIFRSLFIASCEVEQTEIDWNFIDTDIPVDRRTELRVEDRMEVDWFDAYDWMEVISVMMVTGWRSEYEHCTLMSFLLLKEYGCCSTC
ncbi:hypothetical protein HF086_009458 [Spodoptera exigua]|uniref:CCHC-type domain-containing protein n=1 Tax=Spodoptera exigua TaxID=7107 RepID=A0A922MHR2_SPOEX|nr:hypothetical protein HF086_009458 [Spodoptera exigua]